MGRATRNEFWVFNIYNSIFSLVLIAAEMSLGLFGLSLLYGLATLIPGIAVTVRRLHDTGRKGWWVLIGFIPLLGIIVLTVFMAQRSQPDNQFGMKPGLSVI